MLVEKYEPNLLEEIRIVEDIIDNLRMYNDPEYPVPLEQHYHTVIVNDMYRFEEVKKRLSDKFGKINRRYYKKGGSKLLPPSKKLAISHSSSRNQNPHVQPPDQSAEENAAHETFSVDQW